MKTLLLSLVILPFLLIAQSPSFIVTDQNGTVWDSNVLLENGTTIIIEFFSPSMTCWPSSNAIQNVTEAYNNMSHCNNLFFLQVAQWGYSSTVEGFIDEFGDTTIPYVAGYDLWNVNTTSGQELTINFMDFGLMWAYECWILYPDGSYEYDLPGMSGLESNALMEFLQNEGFINCNNVNIEENHLPRTNEEMIFNLQGQVINERPNQGIYIKNNETYFIR